MTTVSAGQSAVVDIPAGNRYEVSTTGEAYVDILGGLPGAGYESRRLIDGNNVARFGPYTTASRIRVRSISGTASHGGSTELEPVYARKSLTGGIVKTLYVLTQTEYDAIVTKDPTTLYLISGA